MSEGHVAVFFQSGHRCVVAQTIVFNDENGQTVSHTATRT